MAGGELLDGAAQRLYRAFLAVGGRVPFADLVESERPALEQLLAAGLVLPDAVDRAYVAVSPRSVGDRMDRELRASATRMLRRAEQLPDAMAALTLAYEAVPQPAAPPGPGGVIEGQSAILERISELVSECRTEVMAAQPGPRAPETLAASRHQDLALLARGVRLRTVYQPAVLSSPETVGHAALLTGAGARIRVLDEPYQRMLIIDRRVAVVPAGVGLGQADFITDPLVVACLIGVFERDWERAEQVAWVDPAQSGPLPEAAGWVGRLLATGLTQKAVASRLGLGERTVAGHISRLREQHGARTSYQLGWRMRGERDA
ncbi:LuxR family transcriptional regulator [Kitasatospora sp. NPDC096147]|uniref:LuxR family transcriptional regulator n=1 Tax=Kitasatospora sp. NPDC096147 TaxID=3364093 RepID=UPI0038169D7B